MLQIITHDSINPPAMVASASTQPHDRVQFMPISPFVSGGCKLIQASD